MSEGISESRDKFSSLQPEILSKEQLVDNLLQHGWCLKDHESLNKEDLVKLHYSLLTPQPQRKYRTNRRGRRLNLQQQLFSRKYAKRLQGAKTLEQKISKQYSGSPSNSASISQTKETSKGAVSLDNIVINKRDFKKPVSSDSGLVKILPTPTKPAGMSLDKIVVNKRDFKKPDSSDTNSGLVKIIPTVTKPRFKSNSSTLQTSTSPEEQPSQSKDAAICPDAEVQQTADVTPPKVTKIRLKRPT